MGRKQEKAIIRHANLEELNTKIKIEEKSVRVLERLYFIFKRNTPQLAAVGIKSIRIQLGLVSA